MRLGATVPRLLLALLLGLILGPPLPADATDGAVAGHWFRIETHVHSVFSSDAVADVGVLATTARTLGYNAVFLTDHNEGSSFQIAGETANHRTLDESDEEWELHRRGELDGGTARLETTTAFQGTRALHLALPPSSSGTLSIWARRGPLITAGPVMLTFAVLVQQLDPGTGFAALISLGGAPDIGRTVGYTTESGDVRLGQSVTFAWTIGQPLLPAATPSHHVVVFPLPEPAHGKWVVYTVNVSEALAQLPTDQRPHPFAAFLYPRFALSTTGGAAELFLDGVTLHAERPLSPAEEFVARTTLCQAYSDASFQVFCAHEMGQQRHTTRFDFAITDPSQFHSFQFGTDGIPSVQRGGYPTQLNHPGSTIRLREILENQAYGADFLEVRKPEWAAVWDELLLQGVSILGSWGADSHELLDRRNPATVVFTSGLTLDSIVHALYEGRSFLARNTFTGTLLFSPWPDPATPYPARYPIFVSDRAAMTTVFLRITGGLPAGSHLRWIRNGQLEQEQLLSGPAADVTLQLSLEGPLTVVRAEVSAPDGTLLALTQPLLFRDVPGMPEHDRLAVIGINPLTGPGYTRSMAAGIVDAAWDSAVRALLLTLQAPPGARLVLRLETERPATLDLAGTPLPAPTSGSTLSFVQPTSITDLVAWFDSPPLPISRPPPAAPPDFAVQAIDATGIELSWQPTSTKDRPVRYGVERNGQLLALVGSSLRFTDRSVQPGQHYTYTVRAFDLADLSSPPTRPRTVAVSPPLLFADDFESGSLTSWSATGSVSLRERSGDTQNHAALLELANGPATLQRRLETPLRSLIIRFRFQLLDQGPEPLSLLTLVEQTGQPFLELTLASDGRLILRDRDRTTASQELVAFGVWYACQLFLQPFAQQEVQCQPEDRSTDTMRAHLSAPTRDTRLATLTFGQRTGSPRARLLLDDIRLVQRDHASERSIRPWSWGVSRARG
uniref:Uncharacterized protein n=1 Tax=Thermomicrobium roseum TaxID=500 RepID=A0A7C1X4D6_THERO